MCVCVLAQVETVGDKYMTVSGLPEPCTHHAKSICHLALDMLEIAGQVKVDDEPVQVGWGGGHNGPLGRTPMCDVTNTGGKTLLMQPSDRAAPRSFGNRGS